MPGWTTIRSRSCAKSWSTEETAHPTAVSVHTALNSMTLLQWGTEAQKQSYLVPQAKGVNAGCVCADRARRGLGRGCYPDARDTWRRLVHTKRIEVVDLDGGLRGPLPDIASVDPEQESTAWRHSSSSVRGGDDTPDQGEARDSRRQHRRNRIDGRTCTGRASVSGRKEKASKSPCRHSTTAASPWLQGRRA